MADQGIKKAKVSQSTLPSIDVNLQGYAVRYRIISEDKNRTSHWSPVVIQKPEYTFVSGTIAFNKAGSIANVVWDAVSIKKNANLIKKATE